MSYDLCCWRPAGDSLAASQSIYEKLVEEQEVDGLSWISVAAITARFQQALPAIEVYSTELIWEGKDGSIQVSWPIGSKPQHTLGIFLNTSWGLLEDGEIVQPLLEALSDLQCVVYDPQQEMLFEEPRLWSG